MGYYLGNALGVMIDASAGSAGTDGADAGVGQVRTDIYGSGIKWGSLDGTTTAPSVQSYSLNTDPNKCEKYGIPLHMLFPCLENRQFPLFLFQDYPIQLEIEFRESSEYANDTGKVAGGLLKSVANSVLIREVKLVVDYILPPSSVMNKYTEQTTKNGYRFEYPKISVVKKAIPAGQARVEQEVQHRLGQEGKEIHAIYQLKQYASGTDPLDGTGASRKSS